MSAVKAWEKLRAAAESPEMAELQAREYPYRNVALAVVNLRGRYELTQGQLAERIGTTQSVISRLESGRHPVEITLLARIAEALGEPLLLSFGEQPTGQAAPEAVTEVTRAVEAEADRANGELPSTGDGLLDAFNHANTSRDWKTSHRIAAEIAKDPNSPRRLLALALDAYNRHRDAEADRWAGEALLGDLPQVSTDTARLVRGRALIRLEHPRDGLKVLATIAETSPLGWLVPAARADAFVELHQNAKALAESERTVAMAPDVPEARYHAARTAWHADCVWDALRHIAVFRAADPRNTEGLLLHGSILGYVGSRDRDDGALLSALDLFKEALASNDCEALRLYAMTAARLGQWERCFTTSSRLLRHRGPDGDGHCQHTDDGQEHGHFVKAHILPDAFRALFERNSSEIEEAVLAAERRFAASPFLSSQRALVRALAGDMAGTLDAFGRTRDGIGAAPSEEQLIIAAAAYARHDFAGAHEILRRNKGELTKPDGLLHLAECAAAIGEVEEAKAVLAELSQSGDEAAAVATVALSVIRADRAAARRAFETQQAKLHWYRPLAEVEATPRESLWEGRHHPTTPMLDRFPGRSVVH